MPVSARAMFRAISLNETPSPSTTISLKIYYPASYGDSDQERNTGVVPAAKRFGRMPVIIMMPGINVDPYCYSWLAKSLALAGIVTVCYQIIAEEMPGFTSLTPGLDINLLRAENYGEQSSATAIGPLLAELHALQQEGVLAGMLDLDKVILGGHSAGGTGALLNANRQWYPEICGVFSYGAHTGAATVLGWPENTILSLPDTLPVLIIGGLQDGVIANSAKRYSENNDNSNATEPLERTYQLAVDDGCVPAYLVLLKDANHFSLVYPKDQSTGRPFIDFDETASGQSIRHLLRDIIRTFVEKCSAEEQTAEIGLTPVIHDNLELIHRYESSTKNSKV